jgi:hypothetical protein
MCYTLTNKNTNQNKNINYMGTDRFRSIQISKEAALATFGAAIGLTMAVGTINNMEQAKLYSGVKNITNMDNSVVKIVDQGDFNRSKALIAEVMARLGKSEIKQENLQFIAKDVPNVIYVNQKGFTAVGKVIESTFKNVLIKNKALLKAVTNDNSVPMIITLGEKTESKTINTENGPRILLTLNIKDLKGVNNVPDNNKIESTLMEQLLDIKSNKEIAKSYVEHDSLEVYSDINGILKSGLQKLLEKKYSKNIPTIGKETKKSSSEEINDIAAKIAEQINGKVKNQEKGKEKFLQLTALDSMVEEYNSFLKIVDPNAKLIFSDKGSTIDKELGHKRSYRNLELKLGGKSYLLLSTQDLQILTEDLKTDALDVGDLKTVILLPPIVGNSKGSTPSTPQNSNKKVPKAELQSNKKTITNTTSFNDKVATIVTAFQDQSIPLYLDESNTVSRVVKYLNDQIVSDEKGVKNVKLKNFVNDAENKNLSKKVIDTLYDYKMNTDYYKDKYGLSIKVTAIAWETHSYRVYGSGSVSKHNISDPRGLDLSFEIDGKSVFDSGTLEQKKRAIDMFVEMSGGSANVAQLGTNVEHNHFPALSDHIAKKKITPIGDGPAHLHVTYKE